MKKAGTSFNWPALLRWSIISWVIVILDQASKNWFKTSLYYGQVEKVTEFFNLVMTYNTGAAFSFLADAGGWQRPLFATLSCLAILGISWIIGRQYRRKWLCFGLALVLGGAVGNAYDRIFLGYVVDFLDFHLMGYHWPAFNIADTAICVGAAIVVLAEFFNNPKKASQ